ncbi:MAG: hypothetical protein K2J26_07640 [Ruminococcus sp.]|nr:hypothetical protein [Ruminococcus sp.]
MKFFEKLQPVHESGRDFFANTFRNKSRYADSITVLLFGKGKTMNDMSLETAINLQNASHVLDDDNDIEYFLAAAFTYLINNKYIKPSASVNRNVTFRFDYTQVYNGVNVDFMIIVEEPVKPLFGTNYTRGHHVLFHFDRDERSNPNYNKFYNAYTYADRKY